MTNLVRGGVILSLIGMLVVFVYAGNTATEDVLIANDSQSEVNTGTIEENTESFTELEAEPDETKKLVKKTVYERRTSEAAGAAKTTSAVYNKGSFTATAYCLKGRMANGQGVRRGVIAADPRVLRLGSRINLGAGAYSGQYLVADTGGVIKGRKIDIWVPNCTEARRFGRRTVQIGLLGQ